MIVYKKGDGGVKMEQYYIQTLVKTYTKMSLVYPISIESHKWVLEKTQNSVKLLDYFRLPKYFSVYVKTCVTVSPVTGGLWSGTLV